MANKKTKGGIDIKKGQVLNEKGYAIIPAEVRHARTQFKEQFDKSVLKLTNMSIEEANAFIKDKSNNLLDMAIATCYLRAVTTGDHSGIAFFLDRIVGKPKFEVQFSGDINQKLVVDDTQLKEMAKEFLTVDASK